MKKVFSFLIAVIILLSALMSSCSDNKDEKNSAENSTAESTSEEFSSTELPSLKSVKNTKPSKTDNICYTYDKGTETLTIKGKGDMKFEDYLYTPWVDVENPKHIVVGSGVTGIMDYCFSYSMDGNSGTPRNYYDKIKTVKIADTVTKIGECAFTNCRNLEKINMPDNVTEFGEWVFMNCKKLKSITFPGGIKTIPVYTCKDCKELETVVMSYGVKKIDNDAFSGCINLKDIVIPNSVNSIGDTFAHCNSLVKIRLPKELKTIKFQTFYSCKNLKKVTIQNKVTKIERFAFDNCISLKKIIVPKSVKAIGKKAFGYKAKWIDNETLEYEHIKGFIIKGYKGTVAEKYAKKNGFKFVALN